MLVGLIYHLKLPVKQNLMIYGVSQILQLKSIHIIWYIIWVLTVMTWHCHSSFSNVAGKVRAADRRHGVFDLSAAGTVVQCYTTICTSRPDLIGLCVFGHQPKPWNMHQKTEIATTRTHVRFSYFALILWLGRQFSEAEVGVVFSDALRQD